MYIRNVSELHCPIFLIVISSTPLRNMAVAPPNRRLWVLTWVGNTPIVWRFRAVTAFFRALVIVVARMTCGPAVSLYVVITSLRKLGFVREFRSLRRTARTGQSSEDS